MINSFIFLFFLHHRSCKNNFPRPHKLLYFEDLILMIYLHIEVLLTLRHCYAMQHLQVKHKSQILYFIFIRIEFVYYIHANKIQ